MGDRFTVKDLWFFIKTNKKYIISITVLFLIAVVSYMVFLSNREDATDSQLEDENQEEVFEYTVPEAHDLLRSERDLTGRQQNAVSEVLENRLVFFRVFIENDDFTVFNRRHLLKEILINDDVVSMLEFESDSVEELLEYFVQVDLDTNTGIFSIEFTSGDEQLNFELANAYFDLLNSDALDIMTERDLYFFDEPKLLNDVEETDTLTTEAESDTLSVLNIIYFIAGGVIFGLIFGFLTALLISLVKKQVSIIYNLTLDNNDKAVNLTRFRDTSNHSKNIIKAITYPPNIKRAILMEEGTFDMDSLETNRIQGNLDVQNHFNAIQEDTVLDEVVIIVKIDETSKRWYETQLTLIKGNKIPLKVVKV